MAKAVGDSNDDRIWVPTPVAMVTPHMENILLAYAEFREGRTSGQAFDLTLAFILPPEAYAPVRSYMAGRDPSHPASEGRQFRRTIKDACDKMWFTLTGQGADGVGVRGLPPRG